MKRLLAAVLASALGSSAASAPSAPELDARKRALDFGLWNRRINALYDAAELGRDALPLLVYASDDADWQVRLTAAHFLGKLGPEAAPALGALARAEPCPRVRVSALRWLAGMGPAGRAALKKVMTPEDERDMESLPDRFGTERMGKPLAIDPPGGEMSPEFFDHGLDLRACASSEYANRRDRREAPGAAVEDEPAPQSFEVVTTPPVRLGPPVPPKPESLPEGPPAEHMAVIETEIPNPGPKAWERKAPETMPPGPPGFEPRVAAPPEARAAAAPARRPVAGAEPKAPPPPAETMPAAGPGMNRAAPVPGAAGLVADAGTGKAENDPVPELIRRLSSPEPRVRARAADELGKRGAAAAAAAPALRRALKDRDRRVRASAVLALGGVAGPSSSVAADLRRALRDKNEDVRFSAVIALERLRAAPKTK